MEITKKMLVDIRPEIEEALKGVADKFGISMSLGNGVYGGLEGHFKLLLNATGEQGETKESEDFKRYASRYGLKPEWFGETFTMRGETYTLNAIYPKKRKMPIGILRSDGKQRIMGETSVRQLMIAQGYDAPYYYADTLVPSPTPRITITQAP